MRYAMRRRVFFQATRPLSSVHIVRGQYFEAMEEIDVACEVSPCIFTKPNTWGPVEADPLTAASGTWCDPIATGNEMQGAE